MTEPQGKKRYIEFDEVFKFVKTFGFYQHLVYWSVSCLKLPMGLQFGFLIFAFGTPSFRCTTANVTCPIINKCCVNCTSYAFKNTFTSTVTEWNLICDRAHIAAAIQSSFFGGMLLGSAVGGVLSDTFGRKKCMFFNCFFMAAVSLGSAFANSAILICVLRFIVGYCQISLMISQYTFLIELVGPRKRTMAAKATQFFWKFSTASIVIFAYFMPNWRYMLIAGSLPGFVFVLFYKLVPESPRWLVAHGHLIEAHTVLMKYGSKTDKPLDGENLMTLLKNVRKDQLDRIKCSKKHHTLDMVKTPRLRRWTFIMCYNWFVVALLFFALMLFVSQLPGNIYIIVLITSTVDIPSICLGWLAVVQFGRRVPYFIFGFVAAIMCFAFPFIPREYALTTTALALIGKSFMGANFSNIYLITSELYPTVIRNIAIGTGSMAARFGAILAPYFVMMAQLPGISLTLPMCMFGSLAIVSSTITLFLPETLFANMQQSIEETETAELDYSVPWCGKPWKARAGALEEIEPLTANGEVVEVVTTV